MPWRHLSKDFGAADSTRRCQLRQAGLGPSHDRRARLRLSRHHGTDREKHAARVDDQHDQMVLVAARPQGGMLGSVPGWPGQASVASGRG